MSTDVFESSVQWNEATQDDGTWDENMDTIMDGDPVSTRRPWLGQTWVWFGPNRTCAHPGIGPGDQRAPRRP